MLTQERDCDVCLRRTPHEGDQDEGKPVWVCLNCGVLSRRKGLSKVGDNTKYTGKARGVTVHNKGSFAKLGAGTGQVWHVKKDGEHIGRVYVGRTSGKLFSEPPGGRGSIQHSNMNKAVSRLNEFAKWRAKQKAADPVKDSTKATDAKYAALQRAIDVKHGRGPAALVAAMLASPKKGSTGGRLQIRQLPVR